MRPHESDGKCRNHRAVPDALHYTRKIADSEAAHNRRPLQQGDGNPDIIIDNRSSREAVILELNKADGKDISKLKNAAETALEQIRKNNYDRDLKERNYRKIVNYGISFYGKECLVIKMPDETASS